MKKRLIKGAVDKLEPRPARYIVWDDRLNGFGVRVGSSGEKVFVLKYRFPSGRAGKVRWFTIGTYSDELPPDRARERAEILRGDIRRGVDPMGQLQEQRREAEAERAAPTVESVGHDFIETVAKKEQRRWKEESDRILRVYINPVLGSRKIGEVRRTDVKALMDQVERDNGRVMAHRVFMQLRRVMNWWATCDDDYISPIVRGMGRVKWSKIARNRVLTDDEIRTMWRALDALEPTYRQLVRFLLLSAQRRDECAKARGSEVGHNTGLWTIPPERYKTGIEHKVPLSDFALDQVGNARVADDNADDRPPGPYLFSTRRGHSPYSGFSKSKARLDAEMEIAMRDAMTNEQSLATPEPALKPWRLHDLRRTAKTLMVRVGVRPDISERVLGHVIAGVEGVYDRHDYLAEKRDALERLAEEVRRIIEAREPKVIPFARASRGA